MINNVKIEFELKIELPNLDLETRCSPTFTVIKKSFLANQVLSAAISRQIRLAEVFISGSERGLVEKARKFFGSTCKCI